MSAPQITMRRELGTMYNMLEKWRMDRAARDFHAVRSMKQEKQVQVDPLLHEHTAISQYMLWHSKDGCRVPAAQRGSECTLAAACQAECGFKLSDHTLVQAVYQ